jgi:hypothetical protein
MAKGRDKNFVSIWFWLFSMIVMAIPVVNIIMALYWAFAGENEARKNYFRATIVIFCAGIAVLVFFASLGFAPLILEKLGKLPKMDAARLEKSGVRQTNRP